MNIFYMYSRLTVDSYLYLHLPQRRYFW